VWLQTRAWSSVTASLDRVVLFIWVAVVRSA
jgi:hypothetical protein